MGSTDVRNWMKLSLLLDCATISFRKLFSKAWIAKYGRQWQKSDSKIIFSLKPFKRMQKIQKGMVEEGDITKWDISLLRDVLTANKFLNLPSEQIALIDSLRIIRNEIAHHATKNVSDDDFMKRWDEIVHVLVAFGESKDEFDKFRNESRFGGLEFMPGNEGIDEESIAEAAELKTRGNAALDNGNYLEAIQIFTKGIVLPKLPATDQAILHWNRCNAHLKLNSDSDEPFGFSILNNELNNAKKDAKKVIKYWPDWWRGYFSLGEVYVAMGKLKKAQDILNEALAKEKEKQAIKDALEKVREKLGLSGTMHVDLKKVAKSKADFVQDFRENASSNAHAVLKVLDELCFNCECSELDSFRDCRRGHQSQLGLDGSPSDYRLAAQYYRKAADRDNAAGKLYLGQMILNGDGVKKDATLGMKLLREVTEQPAEVRGFPNPGFAEAEFVFGLSYEDGLGVGVDFKKAEQFYIQSSNHGCSKAANNLGLMYEHGIPDKKQDLAKAENLYITAATSGWIPDSNAMLNLARLYEGRNAFEDALHWCMCARVAGNKLPLWQKMTERLQKKLKEQLDNDENDSGGMSTSSEFNDANNIEACPADEKNTYTTAINTCVKLRSIQVNDCPTVSVYASRLRTAKENFQKAMQMMSNELSNNTEHEILDVLRKFVEYFSVGVQAELGVVEFTLPQRVNALSIVSKLLKQAVPFDEDVRVCYVALEYFNPNAVGLDKFLEECIALYPNNCFFVRRRVDLKAAQHAWKDAVNDIKKAVEVSPKNEAVLCERAKIMQLAISVVNPQSAVDAYKEFLAIAPDDHPGIPDAYYAMAQLKFAVLNASRSLRIKAGAVEKEKLAKCWDEAKKTYEQGLSAEKKQLGLFLPYVSSTKAVTEHMLGFLQVLVETSVPSSSASSTGATVNSQSSTGPDPNSRLNNPHRIEQITQFRAWLRDRWANVVNADDFLSFASKGHNMGRKPLCIIGLKAIFFRNMTANSDTVYEKRTLEVTIIDEVCVVAESVVILAEDGAGNVSVCVLHNWLAITEWSAVRDQLVLGRKLSIINPYVRTTTKGRRVVFVDDQNALKTHSLLPDMCRSCCNPNAKKNCSRCKWAHYCNKDCQTNDWKVLKHKLICQKSYFT